MSKKQFSSFNIPSALLEEMKLWRAAFTAAYGRNVTYEQMLRSMLDGLEDSEPAVWAAMERMAEANPAILDKIGATALYK